MQKKAKKVASNREKIGIITFHFPHNCGAALQAYALQKVLNRYSDCKIINYQPEYHARWYDYRLDDNYPIRAIYNIWRSTRNKLKASLSIVYNLHKILAQRSYVKKRERTLAFERFLLENCRCSRLCRTKTQVESQICQYNTLVAGSDQIWNPQVFGGAVDGAYTLDFHNKKIKKYSYAASAGNRLDEKNLGIITDQLKSFKTVSVRESSLRDQLSIENILCRVDVDPTLLLEKEDYFALENKVDSVTPGKFVFVYAFQISEELVECLRFLKEEKGYAVVSYPFQGKLSAVVGFEVNEIAVLGPSEFLYLMHYAAFVVTATYHGLLFATIYEKPFVCLPPEHSLDRIKDFLSLTDQEDRYWSGVKNIIPPKKDFSLPKILQELRIDSERYLQSIVK